MKKSDRNSNVEILRIIAILLIIVSHFATHGFLLQDSSIPFSYNKILLNLFQFGGGIGVNLFVIISSWYMLNSKFTFKKLMKICGDTWFYAIIIYLLFAFVLTPTTNLNNKTIIYTLFPILLKRNWFITDYILLMLFTPILNLLIKNIDKQTYQKLLIGLFSISCFIAGFIHQILPEISANLSWFIILYLLIGYIKNYVDLKFTKSTHNLRVSIIMILVCFLSVVIFNLLGYKLNSGFLLNHAATFSHYNNIIVLILSVELFLFFIKLPIFNNSIINIVSSTTIGIYLIHDNTLMRPYIWNSIFNVQSFYYNKFMFLYMLFSVSTVFIICSIIDIIRQNTIEKVWMQFMNHLECGIVLNIKNKLININDKIIKFLV